MINCIIGNSTRIKCSELDKKNGFIFMPFDSSENGIYLEPQKKIITKAVFQSVFNNFAEFSAANPWGIKNKKVIRNILIIFFT